MTSEKGPAHAVTGTPSGMASEFFMCLFFTKRTVMKRFFSVCILVLAASLCTPPAYARAENMPQFENEAILSTPAKNAEKIVHDAVVKAAIGRGWRILGNTPKALRLHLNVRNKHQLTVEVKINGSNVSVSYIDSVNLNYAKDGEGRQSIHPSYRKWVSVLLKDASNEAQFKVIGV
ncbi:MAG: hypothetical protein LBU46_02045 [Candidatus Accumulibacter sp.]|nr:hypothetical protein [Accumulibacter sp.]